MLLAHQDVKPKRMLDVCCGTGTMCELMTAEGFELAGFDLSPEMIKIARRKAAKKKLAIRYEVADAAEVQMNDVYDAAFSFFDSLNYIIDPERARQAILRVAEHVRPGGSFVFDVNTAYAFEAEMFDQENLKPRSKVRYKWTGDWNPETRIIKVHMKFWRGGDEAEEMHVQRAHEDEEIRSWLSDAGFVEVKSFHSYTLNPPRYRSDRVHYMAIRA